MKKLITLACALFAFSAMAANQPLVETQTTARSIGLRADKLIDDVLTVTGIKENLQNLPDQIGQGIRMSAQNNPARIPEDVILEMEDAAMEAYSSEALIAGIATVLKEKWHEPRLREVFEISSTPLSRRMTVLESKQPAPAELGAYISRLATQPLPPTRLTLIKQLDAISRGSEFAIKILSSTVHSVAIGVTGGCGDGNAEFNKKFAAQRGQFEENIRNSTRAQMAYIYRDASDTDLRKYLKSLSKESMRWFGATVYDAIDKGLTASGEQMGRNLQEVFKKKLGGSNKGATGGCQEV
ncbi:MAG: hypothetical protein V4568_18510 [Pseudomonadota bacterium]